MSANGLAVFVHGPVALACDIENLAQIDMRPDLGPLRVQVAIDGGTKLIGGRLKVILFEEQVAESGNEQANCFD